MKMITKQKPLAEIEALLAGAQRVYIVGCGTCATMCGTGGRREVLKTQAMLMEKGKVVTGWMVIPTACDELTADALRQEREAVEAADAVLVMTCAFGVQTVATHSPRPVYPALNSLFFGKEQEGGVGVFAEICVQCGDCVLGETGGICPVTTCAKGLLNGPCGGTNKGKCEVDKEKDCAWTLIYRRLEEQGRLDRIRNYFPPKNYQVTVKPARVLVEVERGEE